MSTARTSFSAFGTVALVALAGVLAAAGAAPSHVVLALVAAFLPYGMLVAADPFEAQMSRQRGVRLGLALAALAGAALLAAPPLLSDDLFRFLWDGRVLTHGIDPYAFAPNDAALAPLRNAAWHRINHADIPTIYPPFAQAIFALAALLGGTPLVIKSLALLAHLAIIPLVARVAGPERGGHAALLYALNPLALSETALSGHIDVFAGLAVLGFTLALMAKRGGLAALMVLVASGVKLIGIAIAPLGLSHGRRTGVLGIALALVVAVPLVSAGHASNTAAGLDQFAQRWRGNEGLFVVLEAGARGVVDVVAARTHSAPGHVRLPALASLVALAEGTPFDPWSTQAGEKKAIFDRTDFQAAYVAAMIARALALGLVLGLAIWLARQDDVDPRRAVRAVVLAALLLAPQIHPWYLLWLLPLEIGTFGLAGVVWSATVLVAYAPLGGWLATRTWVEPIWGSLLEHAWVLGCLGFELARPTASRKRNGKKAGALAVQGS